MTPAALQANAQPNSSSTNGATVIVQSTPTYDVIGSNVAQINATIRESSLSLSGNETLTITTDFGATLNATAVESGIAEHLQYTSPSPETYSVDIPKDVTSFDISVQGTEGGATFLWRYIITVPFVVATGLPGINILTTTYFIVPSGTVASQVYGYSGATVPSSDVYQNSTASSGITYGVVTGAGILVFESSAFLPASVAITVCALLVVGLAALNLFAPGRQFFDETLERLKAVVESVRKALRLPRSRSGFSFKKLLQPRKLLALFILCGIVMVAIAALGGPDPQVKAFVVAEPKEASAIQSQLQPVAGNVQVVTPAEDYSDFAVMSSVGDFNLVVFSSYPQLNDISGYVLPSLVNVPVILMDNGTTSAFQAQVRASDPNGLIYNITNSATHLTSPEQSQLAFYLSLNSRTNDLGMKVSPTDFKLILVFEAVLSIVLVFLGWAALGSLTSESRLMSDLSHMVIVVAVGIFVFFFSESLYVATSSLLAFPISLHAVNSGAHITAISLLGFGGGSTPRLAAGFLGVLVGAVGAETGQKFRKTDFALVLGIALILVANPLYIGRLVFQGILLLYPIGSLAFGQAYTSSLTLKGFIYGVGSALGGGVTPTYLLSAGSILYFAGLVPLAYLKKMGATTSVIALLFAALILGDGGVRVGQMTPDGSEIAVLPGLFLGFAFAVVILAFAAIEKYVRGNWRSRV